MNHLIKLVQLQCARIIRNQAKEFPEVKIQRLISDTIAKIWRSATQRVMSLTLMGMLMQLGVDVLIAARLGTGQSADALIVALSVPFLINTVTRRGTRYSMVPLFMEHRAALSEGEYRRFVSGLINFALVFGSSMLIIIEVLAPELVAILAPGFPLEGREEAARLLRVCGPILVFAMGTTVLSVLLNSQKHFSLVAMQNLVVPGIVMAAMAFARNTDNIALVVAGVYALGFAGFFLVLFVAGRWVGHRHQWLAWVSKRDLLALWRSVSLPTLGVFVRQGLRIVERLLASLVAVGGVSTYYFAFRIISGTQTLIGGSILTTTLPTLVEDELAGDKSRLTAKLRRGMVRSLLMSLPAALIIFLFHAEIVGWVYGRGYFGKASIDQTSLVLLWLGMGLFFSCLVPVLQSGLYAQKAYGMLLRNTLTVTVVNAILAWLFSQVWGLVGIAMAVSLTVAISTGLLISLLGRTGVFLLGRSGGRGL